jgi:hypothetical protein
VRLAPAAALAATLAACPAGKAADAPPGYEVVRAVGSGRALSRRLPQVRSVSAALRTTLTDLEQHFGAKPQVRGAYEDTRDHLSGGAGFTASVRGRPVQGILSCRIGPEGAFVAVVYADADAPRGDLAKLMEAPPGGGGGPGAPRQDGEGAPAGQASLEPFRFPDGTCVMGLARGWHTPAQSCAGPAVILGPADQTISMGLSWSVNTPDSLAVQNHRQMLATARQLGSPPPQFDMLVAPFSGPLDALKNLAPQLSQMAARRGGKPFRIENPVQRQELRPNLSGGRAALLTWGVSEQGPGGSVKHYRSQARLETAPVAPGAWMMVGIIVRAPDASFERDLPVMLAMVQSLKENAQAINQKTQQGIQAQNQWFQAQQKAHRAQVEGFEKQQQAHREASQAFDQRNRDWERGQNETARGHDDFSEVLRGYRTVEDTTTGVKRSVDLGNVDVIVDKLNEADPGRYRQIPLRDELDPKPGR